MQEEIKASDEEDESGDEYGDMTDADFDSLVFEIAKRKGTDAILSIAGVWDYVREELNNEALDLWRERNPLPKE